MRNWLVVAVSLLLWLMLVSAASAGEWTQVTCTQPNEQPAPIEGWSTEGIDGPGDYSSAYSTCEQPGGALIAESSNQWPQARESAWAWHFSAPSGSTIAGGTLSVDLYAPLGRSYIATPNDIYDGADVLRNCQFNEPCSSNNINGGPFAGTIPITHPGPNIYAEAQCEGAGQPGSPTANCGVGEGANGVNAQTMVYAADIELANSSTPAGTAFAGTLLEAGTSGHADLTFTAQDPGGPGVYKVTATLDGTSVYHETPDTNGGKCASIGRDSNGVAEFLHAQPCKQTVAVDIPVETTKFSDGSHELKVEVEDVAGNKAVVLDRRVSFTNHPAGASVGPGSPAVTRGALNGVNASDEATLSAHWTRTSKTALTSRYGVLERITGRLTTSAGQPISGALLDVYATPGYEGAQARLSDAGPRTDPTGSWTLTLPRDVSSSALRFVYYSHVDDTIAAASATLDLNVHAGLAFNITPRIASVGGKIYFNGVLHGAPIPPGGKQLVLEASSGGEWVKFNTITTNAKGSFHASYRFKYPGPVTYHFRVVSPHEADFPFLDGSSNRVSVREH